MRTRMMGGRWLAAAAIAAWLAAAGGEAAQAASCLVRISYMPGGLPISEELLPDLLMSNGVLVAAVRDVPELVARAQEHGMSLADTVGVGVKEAPPTESPLGYTLTLKVEVDSMSDNAAETERLMERVLVGMCRRLARTLDELAAEEVKRLDAEYARVSALHEEARARCERLRAVQRELIGDASEVPDSGRIRERMTDLAQQRRRLELSLASMEARREAVMEQVAQLRAEVERQMREGDLIRGELRNVLANRERELQRTRELVQQGQATEALLNEHGERVIAARTELLRHEEARAAAQGEQLGPLSGLLQRLVAEHADAAAQLRFLTEELRTLRESDLLQRADRYEELERDQLAHAEQTLFDLAALRNQLQAARSSYTPPVVTILGAPEIEQ